MSGAHECDAVAPSGALPADKAYCIAGKVNRADELGFGEVMRMIDEPRFRSGNKGASGWM